MFFALRRRRGLIDIPKPTHDQSNLVETPQKTDEPSVLIETPKQSTIQAQIKPKYKAKTKS